LKAIQYELKRLELAKRIPGDFQDIKEIVYANGFGVFEAMLNFVGQQLTYFATAGGKLGAFP
jgi:hypothetical protein